jgi:hypothetical protein
MKSQGTKRVKKPWLKEIIPNYVIPILKNLGYVPTLRGMFYILLGKPYYLISKGDYASMGKALTRARKKGTISKTAFADKSRRIIKNFDDEYETLDEFVQRHINYVQNPLDYYTIPRWHNQPNYVEVWIEKDAMASSLASILRGQQVIIVPNRGWSSITYITNNIERLIEHLESNTHEQVF